MSLTKITLPFVESGDGGSSTSFLPVLFGQWSSYGGVRYVPESLKTVIITGGESIGEYAFYNCSGLTSIEIPESVTSIGSGAFRGCSGLTSIAIPDSVTSIGRSAFSGCSGLTSITIPNSVTEIWSSAFEGCSGLTSVYYMGTSNEWSRISIGSDNSNLTNASRYYYSAEENYDGKHWHYDPVTNQPVVWTKEKA